jgi:hypothetical protein
MNALTLFAAAFLSFGMSFQGYSQCDVDSFEELGVTEKPFNETLFDFDQTCAE